MGGTVDEVASQFQALQDYRKEALLCTTEKAQIKSLLTVRGLQNSSSTLRDNSSSDQLSTRLVSLLPEFILEALVQLFCSIVDQVALPYLSFQVFLFLLHKELGGFRTIGMFPALYRIFIVGKLS